MVQVMKKLAHLFKINRLSSYFNIEFDGLNKAKKKGARISLKKYLLSLLMMTDIV